MTNLDKLIQALAQHSAYSTRASTHAVNELLKLFNTQTNSMLDKLLILLLELSDAERAALMAGKYTTPPLREIQSLINDWQSDVGQSIAEKFDEQIHAFAAQEAQYVTKLMQASGANAGAVAGAAVVKAAKSKPVMGGRLIDEMLSSIDETSRNILLNTTRQGIADGLTNQQIIQRLRGTKAADYIDGLLNAPRQSLDRDVRTIRNHIGNTAYAETYKKAGIEWIQFVATLDGRTSKQCASLDGNRYKTSEPHPTPPMHPNCRSVTVPIFDEDEKLDGRRPENGDKRGTVSANETYASWFSKQSEAFQQEWLGPSRYKLYKDGKYTIGRFVDPQTGKQYSLAELQEKDEQTFKDIFGE